MLIGTLIAVAFTAGVAGTWSPCGFSAIETISNPRRHVIASSAAFAVGAVVGGATTFGVLALVGTAAHATPGPTVVAVIAAIAAVAEARGLAVLPQVRRQVPEHWRGVLPLPLAAGLYGVLLGLGFTTFVYTFALWALAAIVLLAAAPVTGVLAGVAFGVGRALPVVLIAPFAHRRIGRKVVDVMAQRPRTLRVVRLTAAACLLAVMVTSLTGSASAATNLGLGTDPSVTGTSVVWTTPTGGVQRQEDTAATTSVPAHASVGGSLLAWREGTAVHVVRLADMSPVLDLDVPGLTSIAVSDTWLVVRTRVGAIDELTGLRLASPDTPVPIARAAAPTTLGRPALENDLLVYHVAARRVSSIMAVDLASGTRRVARRSTSALLTNPAVLHGDLVYDRLTSAQQLLQVGPLDRTGADRVVYKLAAPSVHDAGHEHGYSHHTRTKRPPTAKWRLWTTALSERNIYVTLLPRVGAAGGAQLVSVPR